MTLISIIVESHVKHTQMVGEWLT